MRVKDEDMDKIILSIQLGAHLYKSMPSGFRSALANFSCALDIILSEVGWKTYLV